MLCTCDIATSLSAAAIDSAFVLRGWGRQLPSDCTALNAASPVTHTQTQTHAHSIAVSCAFHVREVC